MNQERRSGGGAQESVRRRVGPRKRWCIVAPLLVVMSVAGCATTVAGTARSVPSPAQRSLAGPAIEQVLLGDGALSRILNQPFKIDMRFPPRFGGPEQLLDDRSASLVDCLGVAAMLQRVVYKSGKVKHVAVETWRPAAKSVEMTDVAEGVVSLPTAAEARALFAKFSQQWRKCDGTTVPLPGQVFKLKAKTSDVRLADSVVAATVSTGFALPGPDSASIPAKRAIGVRGNCLVEVEVDYFNASNPPHLGSGDINSSAAEIAHNMLDEVGAPS